MDTGPSPSPRHNIDPARRDFYARGGTQHLAPLWEVLHDLITAEPASTAKAHLWRYVALRPLLLESCGLITAREAERRVLVLENPAYPGQSRITRSLRLPADKLALIRAGLAREFTGVTEHQLASLDVFQAYR